MYLSIWFKDSHLQVNVIAKGKSQENSTHLLLWEQINSFTIFSESYNYQKNIPETVEKVKWISSSRNFSINKEIDHKPLLDKRGTWMLENWIIQYLLSCILFTWDLFQCMAWKIEKKGGCTHWLLIPQMINSFPSFIELSYFKQITVKKQNQQIIVWRKCNA